MIGSAGHIDCGENDLIKAPTAIDTHRLKEEKAKEVRTEE